MALAPAPKTWVDTTDFFTAAVGNLEIRDALNFLLNKPRATLRRVANQSVPDTTAARAAISWDTEDSDSAAMWSSGTNIVTQYAGRYVVSWVVNFATDPDGTRAVYIEANGSTEWAVTVVNACTASSTVLSGSFEIPQLFAVGEYIRVKAGHSAGAALNVTASVSVSWVGKS